MKLRIDDGDNQKEGGRYADAGKALEKLFGEATSRKEYLELSRELLSKWSGCGSIGIRILTEEKEIPFETFSGYNENFLENENWLTLGQDKCICIRVSLQEFANSDSAIRTVKGSVFSNNFGEFMDQLSAEELTHYRGACTLQGYSSVAIMPIAYRGKILGVIHLADEQERMFSPQTIDFLETVATYIGVGLNRFNVEEQLQRHNDTLGTVAELLNLAIGNAELDEIIKHSLNTLLSIPWLSFDSRGSIYLVEKPNQLVLQVASGMEESHLESCGRIPFGQCLCGQAALQKEIQFASDHFGSFPHGHYCVPIISDDTVLGVINIYLRQGHHRNQKEELFLTTIANTLAGIIIRKQIEMSAKSSNNRNKLILESMGEGIYGVDLEGKTIFINPKAIRMTGYEQENLVGHNLHFLIHHSKLDGSSNSQEQCPIYQTIKKGTRQQVSEDIFWRKDGSSFPVEYVSTPVLENGEIIGAVIVFKDITERKQSEEALKVSFENLTKTLNETVNALAVMSEKRDPYTAGHQKRVAHLAIAIAKEMGLSAERIESIRIAGTLHDIGKIYVPTEILNKPGKLNDLEMALIKTHSQVGYEVLKSIPFACPVAEIVWQHHEKINGTGYPMGLKEDEVFLEAKILCVADVVEAIASHRPYRPSLGLETALKEISQQSGVIYDSEVVNACLTLFTQQGYQIQ